MKTTTLENAIRRRWSTESFRLRLLPYQSAFAANDSRFKIGLWARQTGKDHTATAEAVIDCLYNPGTTWIILAASERQALESLAKAKDWANILQFRVHDYDESFGRDIGQSGTDPAVPDANPLAPERGEGQGEGASFPSLRSVSTRPSTFALKSQLRLSKAEITWSNRSRLIALPANPHTVRGYSANLILTEFAFHEDADAIWRAIYPSISNPLRGGLKKLRIISTPNGLTNKFADLWFNTPGTAGILPAPSQSLSPTSSPTLSSSAFRSSAKSAPSAVGSLLPPLPPVPNSCLPSRSSRPSVQNSSYFKHKITIHDAIASGLPLDAAELQAGLNDADAWSQEYLCEFTDSSSVMFPYDLIAPCESELASESAAWPLPPASSQLYAGIDFGRKNHLTVCWILEALPARNPNLNLFDPSHFDPRTSHLLLTREVLCLKNTSTPDQIEILRPRLKRCRKICLDYTGAGIGLGDYLAKEFGGLIPSPHEVGRGSGRGGKIELCQFTNALKSELFPRLRAAFEQRLIRIPISRDIREDLHAIQRTVTQSGQITYRAPQTADGHSDRTTALALALRAATSAPLSYPASSIFVPGRSADLRWISRVPRLRGTRSLSERHSRSAAL